MNVEKVTVESIRRMKGKTPIAALTAYDYPQTRLLDEAGIPFILVGDSVGNVLLGYPDTTLVTMEDMVHHVRAAARAKPAALLVADLPHHSYESVTSALANARRLVAAGAEAVKAEGGRAIIEQARAIVAAGIPFCGHLGMLPQKVHESGGYRAMGKSDAERHDLLDDARALAEAGAFAIVLEIVVPGVAKEITRAVAIPTIGIASGPDCDGQILVTNDLWGTTPGRIPRHVKPRLEIPNQMRAAVREWKEALKCPASEVIV